MCVWGGGEVAAGVWRLAGLGLQNTATCHRGVFGREHAPIVPDVKDAPLCNRPATALPVFLNVRPVPTGRPSRSSG